MKAPKGILSHPAVARVLDGEAEGFADYKYDVELKPGYRFRRGRMAGCNNARFNNVADFLHAEPTVDESE